MERSKSEAAELAYQRLMRLTTRLFYGIGEALVMETLIHAPRQQTSSTATRPELQLDEAIAERLQLHPKQVRTLLAPLQSDRLVVSFRKETKAEVATLGYSRGPQAPSSENVQCFYGLDYETAADAVRFKLSDIDRMFDEERRATAD